MNIAVVDVGTSSIRLYVFGEHGDDLYHVSENYSVSRNGACVEMDASLVVSAFDTLVSCVGKWSQKQHIPIHALALTSQRSSVVGVDEKGNLLSPMMMWQDTRSQGICTAMAPFQGTFRSICGMTPSPVYSAPKIVWIQRNRHDVAERATKFVGFYELLLFHLTGEWVTDLSVASRSCLLSLDDKTWSPELIKLFGVHLEQLCRMEIPGTTFPLKKETQINLGQDQPVIVVLSGGDQQCAAMGSGCFASGTLQINVGTGGYVMGVLDRSILRTSDRVVYNFSVSSDFLLAESNLKYCGSAVMRLANHLYPENHETIYQEVDRLAFGDAVPFLDPLEIGDAVRLPDDQLDDAIQAFLTQYDPPHIVAGLYAGIIRALASSVSDVEEACHTKASEIICGGGFSKNGYFCQRLANEIGQAIHVEGTENATAYGAFLVARKALNVSGILKVSREQVFIPK